MISKTMLNKKKFISFSASHNQYSRLIRNTYSCLHHHRLAQLIAFPTLNFRLNLNNEILRKHCFTYCQIKSARWIVNTILIVCLLNYMCHNIMSSHAAS